MFIKLTLLCPPLLSKFAFYCYSCEKATDGRNIILFFPKNNFVVYESNPENCNFCVYINLQLIIFRIPDTNLPPNDNPVPYCEFWTLVECIQQILDAYEICTGGKGVHQIMFETHSASINWRK